DSLLAKLVVWGRTREEAIVRTRLALQNFEIKGVSTTIPFHLMLLDEAAFVKGDVYTTYVESEMKSRYMQQPQPVVASAQAAAATISSETPAPPVVRQEPRTFEVE